MYAECLRRAEGALLVGRRVIVDANFRDAGVRLPFAGLAERLAVPLLFVVCTAAPAVVRDRLAGRHGDASEADWSVYEWAAERWREPGPDWESATVYVSTDAGVAPAAEAVRRRLRAHGLLD